MPEAQGEGPILDEGGNSRGSLLESSGRGGNCLLEGKKIKLPAAKVACS